MKKKILLIILCLCLALSAYASDKAEDVKRKLTEQFTNFKITDVIESEIPGLYEVVAGGNIMYSDGSYILMGHMFDFTGKDITQEKINGLTAKMANQIDKSIALKVGSGKKEVIEITDPECPYCLKAEEFFKDADVNRYIYFFPLSFHKNAERLSVHILCSKDSATEYEKVLKAVSEGKADSFKTDTCEAGKTTLKKMMDVAQQLGVRGTPFFIIDGKVISGADPVIRQMIK
ncbi:MAG: DsbC family protein [Deferribacterales bacterium]